MEKLRFSVIIPVYNGEKYLGQCVGSVLNQNYNSFEIILVDDGSTDNSFAICESFKDERIRVFRKQNEGPLLTRVFAASKAKGDYCLFIDCDDYIESGYFERLNSIIERENSDVIVCSFKQIGENKIVEAATPWKTEKIFCSDGLDDFRRELVLNSYLNSMCTKTIRTELLKNDPTDFSEFASFKNGEDLIQSLYPVFNAEKIVYIPECFYNYRSNASSITHNVNVERYKSTLAVRECAFDYLKASTFFDEELHAEYANVTVKALMNFIKSLAETELSTEEKISICEEISANKFYKNEIRSFYDDSKADRKTKAIFKLFRSKRYTLMFRLINCFFEVKRFGKCKNKQNN